VEGKHREPLTARILRPFVELFGLSRGIAAMTVFIIGVVALVAIFYFIHLAPPRTITITTGPPGSSFYAYAERYAAFLRSNGVTLKILPSEGSQENLQRLSDRSLRVDIGFAQGGVTNAGMDENIVSLGSIAYQPLLIFYRSPTNVDLLVQFKGKRLAVGSVGSGTRFLSMALLAANNITNTTETTFLDLEAAAAAKALEKGDADAVFFTGDSASAQLMRQLLLNPEIKLFNFTQADAYTRRISYLNRIDFPKGSLDFARDLPTNDVHLVAPTVELLARENLHPALIDLVLEAARDVHGKASLLKRKGEFPAPLEHDIPISAEALRYYKSGKSFMYRHFPFWIASVANRVLLVIVPAIVLLIPALRLIPTLLKFRTKLHLYRWYRELLSVERELHSSIEPERRKELLKNLDNIERHVSKMKIPASFADQYYTLRGDINFVRSRLQE